MTAIAIRLARPIAIAMPAGLLRLQRSLAAMHRLARYPSRRRAERVHSITWAARFADHRR